jgi:hypothetical protein
MSTPQVQQGAIDARYPKRKRVEVKYFDSDDSDEAYDTEEDMIPTKVCSLPPLNLNPFLTPSQRAKRPFKPLPKSKIFPFLQLPAELRNRIYEECLKDGDEGIFLHGKQSSYRRVVVRSLPQDCHSQYHRYNRRYRFQSSQSSEDGENQSELKPLITNLLAVNHQIYQEAVSILYNQRITVADTYALHSFLTQLTARTVGFIRHLRISSWCSSRSHKAINFPAMSALAASGAVNLERLELDCALGYFHSYGWRTGRTTPVPLRVARKVYRDCYPWMQAMARAKGDMYAAVDILEISGENFRDRMGARVGTDADLEAWDRQAEEEKAKYKKELKKLIRKN